MSRYPYSPAGRAKNFAIEFIVREDGAKAFKTGLVRQKHKKLLEKLNRREIKKRR
jgi:hypothetical protein